MITYFISDVHLQASEPKILQTFFNFLKHDAPKADAVYNLGDLFEAWIGDDDTATLSKKILNALKELTSTGTPTYFMRGNRDFAVGDLFAQKTGVTILEDPSVVNIYGRSILLMHGDLLCTDDEKYQAFRQKVYLPGYIQKLYRLPLFIRRLIAAWARYKSRKYTQKTDLNIQDVNQIEVEQIMNKYQVDCLIHGHTHRPAHHEFTLEGKTVQRIVLPAWHDQGYVCILHSDGRIEDKILKHPSID
jgi:UDP-2,3-diacylglucosamine hydrolase